VEDAGVVNQLDLHYTFDLGKSTVLMFSNLMSI
jgi:hypothetical protein